MSYWCCAQIEQSRDRLAWHCLTLSGYKVYQPLLHESRRSHGRKIIATPPLFPDYLLENDRNKSRRFTARCLPCFRQKG